MHVQVNWPNIAPNAFTLSRSLGVSHDAYSWCYISWIVLFWRSGFTQQSRSSATCGVCMWQFLCGRQYCTRAVYQNTALFFFLHTQMSCMADNVGDENIGWMLIRCIDPCLPCWIWGILNIATYSWLFLTAGENLNQVKFINACSTYLLYC